MADADARDARKYRILCYLRDLARTGEAVRIEKLRDLLGVSTNTARRDLESLRTELALDAGRTDGRYLPLRIVEDSRDLGSLREKQEIASNAASWLAHTAENFFQMYLDGGTTCRVIYEQIKDDPPGGPLAVVYTNDISIAMAAARSQKTKTELVPGVVTRNSTVVGPHAENYAESLRFDVAVLSCSEVCVVRLPNAGVHVFVATAASDEVGLKQRVIEHSDRVVIAAERRKICVLDVERLRKPYDPAQLPEHELANRATALLRFSAFCHAYKGPAPSETLYVSPHDPKRGVAQRAEATAPAPPFYLFTNASKEDEKADRKAEVDLESALEGFPCVLNPGGRDED